MGELQRQAEVDLVEEMQTDQFAETGTKFYTQAAMPVWVD
jgi:hypothetical protein